MAINLLPAMLAMATGRVIGAIKRCRATRAPDHVAALREAWRWRRALQAESRCSP